MTMMPALFVSHGAPTLVRDNVAARDFLAGYGRALGRPEAIVVVSAHWEVEPTRIGAAARPATVHDFSGFPEELYRIRYPAPGAPDLAARIRDLVTAPGETAVLDEDHGWDHGVWVPLVLMYPDADVPIVQVSVRPEAGPAWHYRLGELLRPLRTEGVLVLGSGSLTHNLCEFRGHAIEAPTEPWAEAFAGWIEGAVAEGRTDDLLAYRERAPHAARNHPTEEHLVPLFVALGAGTPGEAGRRVHESATFGVLAMDAYAFA
jgi:4,5-DOPA dioxygenase extradiol